MKFIMLHVPTIPGDRDKERPIGRSVERYQQMIREIEQLVVRADELGFYGYGTAEHHFHTEGFEVNSQPMMLYTYLAAKTSNIKFVPLCLVPVSTNPIFIAEQVAQFDQLFQGRIEVGLARGYQSRWMQIMAQKENITAGTSADARNREMYDESVELIKTAWTKDAFSFEGKHIQVPYPFAGIKGYGGAFSTRKYGVEGEVEEIDGDLVVKQVGVVPAPYTQPHPKIWVPFTMNPKTVRDSATNGHNMMIASSKPDLFQSFIQQYQEYAHAAGREIGLGEGIAAVREIVAADSYDEAFDIAVKGPATVAFEYFQHFGVMENWRLPGDDPDRVPLTFDSPEELAQRYVDTDFMLIGKPKDITEKLLEIKSGYGIGANVEHIVAQQTSQGLVPIEQSKRILELIGTEILPKLS